MLCKCPLSPDFGPSLASNCGGSALLIFMQILESFLSKECDLADPCGQIPFQSDFNSHYDFIVIGGGAAGSAAAARLSEEESFSVLLIEAGLDEPAATQVPSFFRNFLGTSLDWNFHTEPEKRACLNAEGGKCFWPRGKVLGGSGIFTGMMYMRGSRHDYDDWEKAGNIGWSFKDVLPYFIKSEDNLQIDEVDKGYHGVGGPYPVSHFPYYPPICEDILRAGKELGYNEADLNGNNHTGFMRAQCNTKDGVRYTSSRAFLRPAKGRNNLHILLNSTVTKILFDENKKAEGVSFLQNGEMKKVSVGKEVIISAGAINSPFLLLHSGIGPSEHLESVGIPVVENLPGVGQNLHNHVSYEVPFYLNESDTNVLNWDTVEQYLRFRNGSMSGTGTTGITAMIKTQYANGDRPDLQFFFNGFWADCATSNRQGKRHFSIAPILLNPRSSGYLRLRDNNFLSKPVLVPQYFSHPNDMKTLLEGVKFTRQLENTNALKKYGLTLNPDPAKNCESFAFGTDDYFECAIEHDTSPENHQGGTCKMGPASDPLAVVDNKLIVRGIEGVRVADTSIMPHSVSGNTHGPTVMIGERVADFIKEKWIK